MDIICAFSSDHRELYKADIYRVLALPEGHIVHFRYKKQYVDENVLLGPELLNEQNVAIFYTFGNKKDEPILNNLSNISIRNATIVHCELSKSTDVFHVYLKLKNFCNVTINSSNLPEKYPPQKFFSKLNCTIHLNDNNWQNRINAIKNNFTDITFIQIQGIFKNGKELDLVYKNNNTFCSYSLIHGDRYDLKLSIGNPKASQTKIDLKSSTDEITINAINPLETSVQFDDYTVPISVKTLQVPKQASLLVFKPSGPDRADLGEYTTNIELNLKMSLKYPLIFGSLSLLAFWGLLIAKSESVSISSESVFSRPLLFAAVAIFISTSSMYYYFNKK